MMRANTLDTDRAMLLVIDLQAKLLPLIPDNESVLAATRKLLAGSRVFNLPVLATEQYAKGLGRTDESIRAELARSGATVLEKAAFSACGDDGVRAALAKIDRTQVIVVGIETHVCVQQTVLDLAAMDYDVFVCADAVRSRGPVDQRQALSRMQHEGAVVSTVESVLFELCERCDTHQFKEMLEVIKATPPADM